MASKPNQFNDQNVLNNDDQDEEEKKLEGLVSGNVGPVGVTPKVVQDSRNWADNVAAQ